ncbi:hypothetical protein OAU25_01515 [Crocinitomicaceae bacterium]|nr:hypothetical protein [Crocinitomicaceae bacterium]
MQRICTLFILIILLISCKKETTIWESRWNVPVLNDTLSLENWVNDTTLLQTASGFYELDLKRTLFEFDVEDIISIPDTTIVEVFDNGPLFDNFPILPGTSILQGIQTYENELILEDLQLKKIILERGVIELNIENPLGTKVLFSLEFPGFSKGGIPFDVSYEIPAGTVAQPYVLSETIDMSDYTIELTGLSGSEYNKFVSKIDVVADANGPSVNFGNEHLINVSAGFKDIKINYARGFFGTRSISDSASVDLSALNVYQSGLIDLPALSLVFEVENSIKVGAQGVLNTVMNTNAQGNSVALTGGSIGNAFNVDPATGSWNTLTPAFNQLEFSSSNSSIESYIENLGMNHVIDYDFELNPWGNISGSWDEIYPHSRLKVNFHAQMPLAIGIDNLVLRDTFELNLNQDADKGKIVSGDLILNTENAFPFSADISLIFLDVNNMPMYTLQGSEQIEAAQNGVFINQHNCNVASSLIQFVLTDEIVSEINEIEKVIVNATLNSENPSSGLNEQMLIPAEAFLGVKLKTKFTFENRF